MKEFSEKPIIDSPYVPIDCGLYDYLELACLQQYEIDISLVGGASCSGVATDTQTKDGAEFLLVRTDAVVNKIRLDKISSLRVVTVPREFDYVNFVST